MPVRRIEVTELAGTPNKWDWTDIIVAAFGLAFPLIAVSLILLTR